MVDDDEEDRMMLNDAFGELGYGNLVRLEPDGESAIAWLESLDPGQLPCLIILDLNMPRLNGRQTLKYIKSSPSLHQIAVVIFSTSLNPFERDECMALGAHSYVVKPITYGESLRIAESFYSVCDSVLKAGVE
jgi:two-component system response regulator